MFIYVLMIRLLWTSTDFDTELPQDWFNICFMDAEFCLSHDFDFVADPDDEDELVPLWFLVICVGLDKCERGRERERERERERG
jgi:hypothetical protein